MGLFGSKPKVTPTDPLAGIKPDYSQATVGVSELQRQLAAATQTAQTAVAQATAKATATTAGVYKPILWLLGLGIVVILVLLLADYISIKTTGKPLTSFGWLDAPDAPLPSQSKILWIKSATYANDTASYDATSYLQSQVQDLTTLPSFTVNYSAVGASSALAPSKSGTPNTLTIVYYVCDDEANACTSTTTEGSSTPTLPESTCKSSCVKPSSDTSSGYKSSTPGFWARLTGGGSSGDIAPSYHDATSSATIKGSAAPLSSESQGGYGLQWWMYVKDWNYGYGKHKSIIKRPDPTNQSVLNPHVRLHPTDNTMQISVSIFPTTENAGKATPAPAGHSGSTDDVFVCEVPNIPLQTWFSVSMTVFGRNLDIYIDGKLVKSCFLSGVPKPATGDLQLTPDGGFSGRICNMYHYPRMLTPEDALSFWSAGTSCRSKTETGTTSSATGYSVKFGVYDTLGKEIQEYTF